MASLTTRTQTGTGATVKGSSLTFAELDNNFINLNTDIFVDNFPSIRPTLLLDFINTKNLDPRITFSRNSTATFFDRDRILRTAGNNIPRLDHDPSTGAARGLLIEEQRTNFFTNASGAAGGAIGTGSVSGPDNVLCRTFIPTAGAVSFPNITGPVQSFTLSLGQTVDWAISGWFAVGPAGTPTLEPRIVVNVSVNNSTSFTYFELQLNTSNWTVRTKTIPTSGTEVSAPTITLFKPGLYRVTWVVRYTQDATSRNNVTASIQARDTANSGTYTADGVSGVQYSLVQVETGNFVTSTIPTTTATVTRNGDEASVNTLSPWYNATEGTLFAEYVLNGYTTGTFPCVAQLGVAGIGNRGQQFVVNVSSAQVNLNVYDDAGAYQGVGSPSGATTLNTVFKAAGAYKANDSAVSFNANAPVTDTSVTLATGINRLAIGQYTTLVTPINGYIRRITYYPRRLSNAQLQAITG